MKKFLIFIGALVCTHAVSLAQPTVLAEQSGVKVSYEAKKLEEDKKHDKWQISITIDNDAPQDVGYATSASVNQFSHDIIPPAYVRIEVTNTKGLFSIGKKEFNGEKTGLMASDGTWVFRVPKGRKADSFNTNVEKGVSPILKATFLTPTKTLSEIELLRADPGEVGSAANRVFAITQTGSPDVREDIQISYMDWDNQIMTASLTGNVFSIGANGGAPRTSTDLNFLGWDRSKMSAKINDGGGFYLFRAGSSTPMSQMQMNFLGGDGYNNSAKLKPPVRNKLLAGEVMSLTENRTSANGMYKLIMQADGNLALINGQNQPIWSSNTSGKPVVNCKMQDDGNLVLYQAANVAAWASGTNGNPGVYLLVQNDGNMVLYKSDGNAVWATNTKGR